MSNVPRVSVRPRGRYVNIDADDTEIGYLTITTDGQVDRAWAYNLGHRWLVDVVSECYRAVLAGHRDHHVKRWSRDMPGSIAEQRARCDSDQAQPLNK